MIVSKTTMKNNPKKEVHRLCGYIEYDFAYNVIENTLNTTKVSPIRYFEEFLVSQNFLSALRIYFVFEKVICRFMQP